MNLASSSPATTWPPPALWFGRAIPRVIRHAHEVLGGAIVYVGSAEDTNAVQQIRQQAGGIGLSLAGKTSVTELAALLTVSDVGVSLDTDTMHIVRIVVLGPSWQKPLEWLPLGLPRTRILRGVDRPDIPPGRDRRAQRHRGFHRAAEGLSARSNRKSRAPAAKRIRHRPSSELAPGVIRQK